MGITIEKLKAVNDKINKVPIKGKDYAQVNDRVKAFREICPEGCIETEILSLENGVVTMKAIVRDEDGKILGTGMAQEKETSSFINKTSFIENCETSAVGRALGFVGIGVDGSMASAEELANAIMNQNTPPKEEKTKSNKTKTENPAPVVNENVQNYPPRDEMMNVAKKHYPDGSDLLKALLSMWKIDSLDKASDSQLMIIFNKYNKV